MTIINFFKKLFSDRNDVNEKAIIGFAAFFIMTIFALVDISMNLIGKEIAVNDFIFNAFLYLTLGCFGIASVDKFLNKKWSHNDRDDYRDYRDYRSYRDYDGYSDEECEDNDYHGDHDHNRRY